MTELTCAATITSLDHVRNGTVGYAWHRRGWEQRKARRFADLYAEESQPAVGSGTR